jgi:hypothetical protein
MDRELISKVYELQKELDEKLSELRRVERVGIRAFFTGEIKIDGEDWPDLCIKDKKLIETILTILGTHKGNLESRIQEIQSQLDAIECGPTREIEITIEVCKK